MAYRHPFDCDVAGEFGGHASGNIGAIAFGGVTATAAATKLTQPLIRNPPDRIGRACGLRSASRRSRQVDQPDFVSPGQKP